jgi:LacI family transcriptional regulator
MAVTQKQIAQHLSMSQPQVAQALNGHPGVSAATRQRVLDAAKAMGYDVNSNARARQLAAIRHGKPIKTGTVAVLMGDFLEGLPLQQLPFFREILQGLHEEIESHDSHIATYYLSRNSKLPRSILGGAVDGVICLYSSTIEHELNQVKFDVPVIRLGGATEDWHLRPDDFDGIYQITNHLIELGHQHIAFLGDIEQEFCVFAHEERLRGYKQALKDAGLELNEELLFNVNDPSHQDGYDTMKAALEQGLHFTAVVCLNDLTALGAIDAAQDSGLNVPQDLSITGFDGLVWDYPSATQLTSVFFDRRSMGRKAVRRIYDAEPREKTVREIVPTQLNVRKTTAVPCAHGVGTVATL